MPGSEKTSEVVWGVSLRMEGEEQQGKAGGTGTQWGAEWARAVGEDPSAV